MRIRYKFLKNVVKPAWDQAPQGRGAGIRLHQKLKCLKEHLKEWTKSTFGNVSQIKEDLLQKFQEIDFTEAEEDLSNLVSTREAVLKKSSLKSQLVRKLNGDRKLDLNGCKKEIIIPNSSTHLLMLAT